MQCKMWTLLYAVFALCTQCVHLAPFLDLEDDQCAGVKCPNLNCENPIKNAGDCCSTCITVGRFIILIRTNLTKYSQRSNLSTDIVDFVLATAW